MDTHRSPKRRPDDGRRAQLIAAATRVVAREGVAAATTRRIAQEAGVPHGLVHYWFSGKDELLGGSGAGDAAPTGGGDQSTRPVGHPVAAPPRTSSTGSARPSPLSRVTIGDGRSRCSN